MAITKRSFTEESSQLSLFDILKAEHEERRAEPGAGELNIHDRMRAALSLALKTALPKSRYQVAGDMSHLLGLEITFHMVNAWVAESKDGHRIAAEYIPAFCKATGDTGPLRLLADTLGVFTLQGPDALRAEIRKDEERVKAIQRDMKKKVSLLDALDSKR